MYAAEGVPLENIQFVDNSRCVDLIEGKPYGLIALLEEECSLGGGSFEGLVTKRSAAMSPQLQQVTRLSVHNAHISKPHSPQA